MSIIKKFLIILIFIIAFFILYRLYTQRMQLKKSLIEGLEDVSPEQNTEFKAVEKTTFPSIGSYNPNVQDLELKQYVIKASCNSARTGKYVNLDMVQNVIMSGCRFLDFEVFSLRENSESTPVVGFSSDDFNGAIESKNTIPLGEVLNRVNNFAFQAPTPNINDPMFIHIRIKTSEQEDSNGNAIGIDKSIYEKVKKIIDANLSVNRYNGKVTGRTKISSIMGKYVVIIDKGLVDTTDADILKNINTYNMQSNSQTLRSYRNSSILKEKYMSPSVKDDNIHTDVPMYKMVLPNPGANFYGFMENPNIHNLIKNYGIQIVCCNFHVQDGNMLLYEGLFGNFKSAIVPLAQALYYINKKIDNQEDI